MVETTTPVRRRVLMRGAAWASPAVVFAAAAPALALSSPCVPVDLGVGARTTLPWDSGWVETLNASDFVANTGTLAGPPQDFTPVKGSRCKNGDVPAVGAAVSNAKVGQRDPARSLVGFTYERTLCFAPGTYTIMYYSAAYLGNPVTAYMKPTVRAADGSELATTGTGTLDKDVVAYGFVDPTTGRGSNPRYSMTNMSRTQFGFQFIISARGTYTFTFAWSFGAIAADANDTGLLERSYRESCVRTFGNDIAVEAPVVTRVA